MNIKHWHLIIENQTFLFLFFQIEYAEDPPTVNYLPRGHEYLSVE